MKMKKPCLEVIKSHIQMAFPTSKVKVIAEESPFYPHKMLILTDVDNCGAFITYIDVEHPPCEEYIEDILIAGIKDVIGGDVKKMKEMKSVYVDKKYLANEE